MKTETDGTSSVKVQSAQEQQEVLKRSFDQHFYQAENRIRFYIERAEQVREIVQDEQKRLDLRLMITYGNEALKALAKGDINHLLQAFDWLHQQREKLNLPFAGQKERGRQGGLKSKKPPNPLDVVLEEILAEFLCSNSEDAWKLWQNWDSPSEAWYGSELYECYYDEGLYHFTFKDQKQEPVTKRDIQQAFSRIRIAR